MGGYVINELHFYRADWDNNLVSIESTLSEPIDIKGKYNIDGIMLILPIKGSGDFDCKLGKLLIRYVRFDGFNLFD